MKKLLVLAIASFSVSSAQAGFLLEPYVGYLTGGTLAGEFTAEIAGTDFEIEVEDGDVDVNGVTYGTRVGFGMAGLGFGGEAQLATPGGDGALVDLGAFISYEFPVMVRVFATYFFSSTLGTQNDDDEAFAFTGTGYKVGLGYTGLPFVAINLEYMMHTYDALVFDDIDDITDVAFTYNTLGITLSAPFDFGG